MGGRHEDARRGSATGLAGVLYDVIHARMRSFTARGRSTCGN